MERYDLMTVFEAASALRWDAATVRRRIRAGEMRATRAGARVWLIPRDEVQRWLVLGKRKPGPKPKTVEREQ